MAPKLRVAPTPTAATRAPSTRSSANPPALSNVHTALGPSQIITRASAKKRPPTDDDKTLETQKPKKNARKKNVEIVDTTHLASPLPNQYHTNVTSHHTPTGMPSTSHHVPNAPGSVGHHHVPIAPGFASHHVPIAPGFASHHVPNAPDFIGHHLHNTDLVNASHNVYHPSGHVVPVHTFSGSTDPRSLQHYRQSPVHVSYPEAWTSVNPVPSTSSTPVYPPPYQPRHQPSPTPAIEPPTPAIEVADFSDDEADVEVEDVNSEPEEPGSIQFNTTQDVLVTHRQRNGSSALPRSAPPTHQAPIQRAPQAPVQRTPQAPVQRTPQAPIQHVPRPPVQYIPQQPSLYVSRPAIRYIPQTSDPLPVTPVRSRPKPTMRPIVPLHLQPPYEDFVNPPSPSDPPPHVEEESFLTLPLVHPAQVPFTRREYPPCWQGFIDHAQQYFLSSMIYSHPFPSGLQFDLWASETIATAFISYPDHSSATGTYCKKSFNAHRKNFTTLALKGSRNQRSNFRSAVLKMVREAPELGLLEKTTEVVIANRVARLLQDDRFLHAPYDGDDCPPDAMYRSPIIVQGIKHLYDQSPWRSAVAFPEWCRKAPNYGDGFKRSPPFPFVVFVATAFRNVLDSLVSGVHQTVPFNEANYGPVYDLLHDKIEGDLGDSGLGETIRDNLKFLLPAPRR